MICNNKWNYNPFVPADKRYEAAKPYICRLSPGKTSIDAQWLPQEGEPEYKVVCKQRQGSEKITVKTSGSKVRIDGLTPYCEYIITVENNSGQVSKERLVRTGEVFGTAVNYLHPDDKAYAFSGHCLCSPSIVRLKSGTLLASTDIFKNGFPQNLTLIYRSDDDGKSWSYVTELLPCFWGKLFEHNGVLYMLAISTEYGDILIGRSYDEGRKWENPSVIARGSCFAGNGFHRAPCVFEKSDGRLWFSIEYGSWKHGGHSNGVMSVDENSDLCDPESWIISDFRPRETALSGAIEGNIIKAPDGTVINFLRYEPNKALLLKADTRNPHKAPEFYKYVEFPAAHTKFEILRHESGKYFAVGNEYPNRNILALYSSYDLESWRCEERIIDGSDCDPACTGFQYPSAIIEGDNILLLSRTAFNGACTFHDNNYCTFHRVNVRAYL